MQLSFFINKIKKIRHPNGQSLIKHFFVDDIKTDKNVTIAANENGTEWKPTPKNETEDNCCIIMDQWKCPCIEGVTGGGNKA